MTFWFTAIALIAPTVIPLFLITKHEHVVIKRVRCFVKAGLAMIGVKVELCGLKKLIPKQPTISDVNDDNWSPTV